MWKTDQGRVVGIKDPEEGGEIAPPSTAGSGPASLRGWYLSRHLEEFDLRLSGEEQAPQREGRRDQPKGEKLAAEVRKREEVSGIEHTEQGAEWGQSRIGVTGTSHDSS